MLYALLGMLFKMTVEQIKAHSTCNCPKHGYDNDVDDEHSVLKVVALID